MKRVIKFTQENPIFSDCSTKYEIMPILMPDSADCSDLARIANNLDLQVSEDFTAESLKYSCALYVTHAVCVSQVGSDRKQWLGFITLPKHSQKYYLDLKESIGNEMTTEDASNTVNNQHYGVDEYGETVDGGVVLVTSGWNYFHEIPLLGYSLEHFEQLLGVTEHGFYDDTERCQACGKFDSRDNGYRYNFREVDGGYFGVNCGCYHEAGKDAYESYINSSDKAIEGSIAKELESEGTLEHVERFIGGMVDGRGGYYAGKPTREGKPESILKALLSKEPKARFIFSHDESGQFQTYFSVYRVVESTNAD